MCPLLVKTVPGTFLLTEVLNSDPLDPSSSLTLECRYFRFGQQRFFVCIPRGHPVANRVSQACTLFFFFFFLYHTIRFFCR